MYTSDRSWLDTAKDITSGDRRRDYGHPILNFTRIALSWSKYLNAYINPVDVVWMMVAMKVDREIQTTKEDNAIDVIGYLACLQEMDHYMKTELKIQQGVEWFKRDKSVTLLQGFYEDLVKRFNNHTEELP